MSRVETMTAERWRVTVMKDDEVTHETLFSGHGPARAYYDHLNISGSTKVLAVRRADSSRFETEVAQVMPSTELWRLS